MSDQNKNAGEMHQLVNEIRSLYEEGSKDVVRTEQLAKMEEAFGARLTSAEDAIAAALAPSNIIKTDEQEIAAKAFAEYLRVGDRAVSNENGKLIVKAVGDQASLSVNAEGGYTLPKIFDDLVDSTNRKASPLRSLARVRQAGMGFVTPIKVSHGDAASRTETGSTHSSSAPQYDTIAPTFFEANGEEMATVWAAQGDATIDLVANIIADVLQSVAEEETKQLLTGTYANAKGSGGTVNNGLLQQTVLHTNVDRFTNTVGSMAGVVAGQADDVKADDILKLLSVIHQRYEGNINILTSRELMTILVKQKDSQGRYMLSLGDYANAVAPQIWGKPVVVSDFFADPATAATDTPLAIAGDFQRGMVIADAAPVSFLVDPYTDKRFIKHLGRKRLGSAIVNYNALRALYAA